MTWFKAFVAGFFSTLVFHQGLLAILHAAGASPRSAYSMAPTAPFRIPAVLSLAFWGGLWGILLWLIIRPHQGLSYWLLALIVGAVAPSLVALFVVLPLKGQPAAGGGNAKLIAGALLLNGVWGIGVAAFMRLFHRPA